MSKHVITNHIFNDCSLKFFQCGLGIFPSRNSTMFSYSWQYQIVFIIWREKNQFMFKLKSHSVKISGFFYHSDFTWNQFCDSRSAKSAFLTHLDGLNFDFLHFCPFWELKFTKWTKFSNPGSYRTSTSSKNWFHIKSEW